MPWRTRRQLMILGGIFLLVVVILAIVTVPKFITPASCLDGKMNQDEEGIDCGGSCALYCPARIPLPDIVWTRAFPTTETVYNLVAYTENHSLFAATQKASYEFRVYDADNILIKRVEGTTAIMPNGPTAIFVGGVDMGNRIPKHTTFTFIGTPAWIRLSPETIARLDVSSFGTRMFDATTDPKLETTVRNNTLSATGPFDVVGILYDALGNALGVSKTFVENLAPEGSENLVMTWPMPFTEEPTTVDIISLPNAFSLPPL